MHQSHKKPKKIGDARHTITKAGLSTIPLIGGPAAELFNAIIVPPLARRRDEWIQGIAVHLEELELKVEGLKVENLSKNESFITTMMHASHAVIRSHQKEKLEALQNAVLNSALPNAPEDDLQIIFLNLIDRYSPSHIRMLNIYYEADIEYRSRRKPDLVHIVRRKLTTTFPDIMERLEFYYQFFAALVVDNLIRSSYSVPQLQENLKRFAGEISPIGIQFIEFITSPLNV
jgi:hypothetical protein